MNGFVFALSTPPALRTEAVPIAAIAPIGAGGIILEATVAFTL